MYGSKFGGKTMIVFYSLLALVIILLFYMRFEATLVETKHVKFTKNKKHLKIIQLSDIHINCLKVSANKVKRILQQEKPDLIIMTGDYITQQKHIPAFLTFLEIIKENHKIVASLGNHEYKAFLNDAVGLNKFIADINTLGITILQNTALSIEKNQKHYNIIGINDVNYSHHQIENVAPSKELKSTLNIGFSHNPDIVFELPQGNIDYLFCGHFHGGQIWAPFELEFKLMRKEKLCKMGIKHGLHKINGLLLYINRGLGNVFVPLRFLSRPEITVFYLP